ncbi:MAG: helix-turn-helix domain-containing protein [Bacillota bacterium]|jgi:AraC-like DNA-binding protein
MQYKNIITQLHAISPPRQPWISGVMPKYEEKLVDWNPMCIQNRALYYQFTTGNSVDCSIDIVPDACINILFKCSDQKPSALVSGIYEDCSKIILEPNTTYFGFKPYSVVGIKNMKAGFKELKNRTVDLEVVFDDLSIIDKISQADNLHERIKIFQNYAMSSLVNEKYVPDFIEHCVILIYLSGGKIGLEEIERKTGYSERYCREKFKELYGISIKHYSRIIRFQNALRMITKEDLSDISDIVYEAGYFDQSHFINEFKRFALISPSKFRNTYINLISKHKINSQSFYKSCAKYNL